MSWEPTSFKDGAAAKSATAATSQRTMTGQANRSLNVATERKNLIVNFYPMFG